MVTRIRVVIPQRGPTRRALDDDLPPAGLGGDADGHGLCRGRVVQCGCRGRGARKGGEDAGGVRRRCRGKEFQGRGLDDGVEGKGGARLPLAGGAPATVHEERREGEGVADEAADAAALEGEEVFLFRVVSRHIEITRSYTK